MAHYSVLVRSAEEYQPLVVSEATGEADIGVHPRSSNVPLDHHELPLDVYQTAELAFIFCLLWFVANWSVNASLDYTTVASATIFIIVNLSTRNILPTPSVKKPVRHEIDQT